MVTKELIAAFSVGAIAAPAICFTLFTVIQPNSGDYPVEEEFDVVGRCLTVSEPAVTNPVPEQDGEIRVPNSDDDYYLFEGELINNCSFGATAVAVVAIEQDGINMANGVGEITNLPANSSRPYKVRLSQREIDRGEDILVYVEGEINLLEND